MRATIKTTENNINKRLNEMVIRGRDPRAFLARVVWPIYKIRQMKRWETENSSETGKWLPLHPIYKAYKLKRYGGGPKRGGGTWPTFPGNGTKLMIATGKLQRSMIGDGSADGYRIIEGSSMIVGTRLPYAKSVNELRDFVKFRPEFYEEIKAGWKKYLLKGYVGK